MTCLGFGFVISSKIWCPTCAGSLSVEPQLLHVCLRSGVLMMSGLAGLGLVLPLCPLGLPGKRFSHFLWSPVRVGYMRFEDGVFGFSCNSSLRFRFMFSSLSFAFSVHLGIRRILQQNLLEEALNFRCISLFLISHINHCN